MSQIIHLPKAVTQRHGAWVPKMPKPPHKDPAKLLQCASAVSYVLNGCDALLIPEEDERAAFLEGMHKFLLDREARRLAREMESAS